MNKVCSYYNKLIISDCSIIISHNHPLATFKCEHCGFTYSRRGPDKEDSDIYKKNYVKNYGHIWLGKLKECVEQGVSFRRMSKLLGCSDIGTIKKHIEKIKPGAPIKNDELKTTRQESIVVEEELFLVEKYKFMFLGLLSKKPKTNALLIYRKYPKAYKMVSQYDREWIENNLLKQNHKQGSKSNKLKKYWIDKDRYIYEKIIRSLEKIKAKHELYERITMALLQKHIGYYNLHQNKSKLPKCFKLINIECETIIDYQKRRINYAIKEMEDAGIRVTFSKILHKAGLKNKVNEEVLSYIKEMMKKEQSMV